MDRDELAAWLRLSLTDGLGPRAACRLLGAWGSPQAIFEQPLSRLGAALQEAAPAGLAALPAGFEAQLQRTRHWLQETPAARILSLGDPLYPQVLLHTPDPPLLLYLRGAGDLQALQGQASLAIVGSRQPTPQGLAHAGVFALGLARAGICVVSGLATGIDGAAHEGALRATEASTCVTLAVLGTGLDRIYPARHRALAQQIAQRGLLLSEYPLGTPPLAHNFPRRNRLIAGLSLGTLVVEAALPSGSLITARLAAELGREVLAIPGSIHASQSRGCHALIRQGAALVETLQDVFDAIPALAAQARNLPVVKATPTTTADPPAGAARTDPLLAALGDDPVDLDLLQARTGLGTASLQARLLDLELAGQAARLPGGRYQRLHRA